MNEELARRAKQLAARTGRSFTGLIEDAVTQFISNSSQSAAPRKRITFPVSGNPQKRITEAEYRAMIEKMYEDEARRIMQPTRSKRDSA